jgi:hypothetical protein
MAEQADDWTEDLEPDTTGEQDTTPPEPEVEDKGEQLDEKPADKPEDKPAETVPLAAHLEERKRLQEQIKNLQSQNEKMAPIVNRVTEWMQRQEQDKQAAEKPTPIDYMDDPEGYIKQRETEVREVIDGLTKQVQQQDQNLQQIDMMQKINTAIDQHESAFIHEHPDYYSAAAHVRDVVRQNLLDVGIPEDELDRGAATSMFQTQVAALQRGKDPAQALYNVAKRFGYKMEKNPAQQGKDQLQEQGKTQEEMEALAREEQGRKASSLGSGGSDDDTLAALTNTEDEVFDEAMRELFGSKR